MKLSSSGSAKVFLPKCKKTVFGSDSLSAPPTRCSSEALAAPSSFPPETLLSNGKKANAELEDPAITSELQRRQPPGGSAQAIISARSDGEPSEERLQRSSPLSYHREAPLQLAKEAIGAPGSSPQAQVLSHNSIPLSRIPELYSIVTGKGSSSKSQGVAAERQVAKEGLLIREIGSSKRLASKDRPTIPTVIPPNVALTTHPSNGLGSTAPIGADPQGPLHVDPSIELKTKFPTEMVIEMQGAAAKKARKTVIGRTLGGRALFKALHECLKLHLPTSSASTTLLTRVYFLILFDSEEGAIATRKLTTIDWSGLSLSFSRFSPDFNASA